MRKALDVLDGSIEAYLAVAQEGSKSVVHEVWQYGSQAANGASVFLLQFLHRKALQRHSETKHRIRPPRKEDTVLQANGRASSFDLKAFPEDLLHIELGIEDGSQSSSALSTRSSRQSKSRHDWRSRQLDLVDFSGERKDFNYYESYDDRPESAYYSGDEESSEEEDLVDVLKKSEMEEGYLEDEEEDDPSKALKKDLIHKDRSAHFNTFLTSPEGQKSSLHNHHRHHHHHHHHHSQPSSDLHQDSTTKAFPSQYPLPIIPLSSSSDASAPLPDKLSPKLHSVSGPEEVRQSAPLPWSLQTSEFSSKIILQSSSGSNSDHNSSIHADPEDQAPGPLDSINEHRVISPSSSSSCTSSSSCPSPPLSTPPDLDLEKGDVSLERERAHSLTENSHILSPPLDVSVGYEQEPIKETDIAPSEKFNDTDERSSQRQKRNRRRRRRMLRPNGAVKTKSKKMQEITKLDPLPGVSRHETASTGFFEDARVYILQAIDWGFQLVRLLLHGFMDLLINFSFASIFSMRTFLFPFRVLMFLVNVILLGFTMLKVLITGILYRPSSFLKNEGYDDRNKGQIIQEAGYPSEEFQIVTDDGYILVMERIPRRHSRKAVYFQHGVVDSSGNQLGTKPKRFAWVATGTERGLAMRAYDLGYDVFLGNFRGVLHEGVRRHINEKISNREYWNFTTNDHAFSDIPAFIRNIQKIKEEELEETIDDPNDPPFTITSISHSMGAMCTIMYLIRSALDQKHHGLHSAILLSPAGLFQTTPRIVKIGCFLLNLVLRCLPFVFSVRFPSELIMIFAVKLMQDVRHTQPTTELVTFFMSMLVGGKMKNHGLNSVHNSVQWILKGTPVGVFRHFNQLFMSRKFQAYDFGAKVNKQKYGSKHPTNFMAHYDLIDIPVYFMSGSKDGLITAQDVEKHYKTLKQHHPGRTFYKCFEGAGHVDFTLGLSDEMICEIIMALVSSHNPLDPSTSNDDDSDMQMPGEVSVSYSSPGMD